MALDTHNALGYIFRNRKTMNMLIDVSWMAATTP